MTKKTPGVPTLQPPDPVRIMMRVRKKVRTPQDGHVELAQAVARLDYQMKVIEHPIDPATPADLKRAARIVEMLTFAIGMPNPQIWERISQAWDVVAGQPKLAERRLRTVSAFATSIEQRRAGNPVSYWRLKQYLVTCDERFGNASEFQLQKLVERGARDGRGNRGGAGRIGAPYVASRVAVKVGAFDDKDEDKSLAAFRAAISKDKAKRVTAR